MWIIISIVAFFIIVLCFAGDFEGKTIKEQEEDYLEKYGYPEHTVIFSDSRGRISKIIGKNVYKKAMKDPVMKRILKEISEKGYSYPENWNNEEK